MEAYQVQLLNIVRYQLFGGDKPETETAELHTILTEAKVQTVFTMVFPFLRNSLMKDSPECFVKDNEIFLRNVIMNTANFLEHDELNKLMTANSIPYSALKGLASAYYYPEASLRDMGDVDFLVRASDFDKTKAAVESIGFVVDHGE